MNDSLTQKHIYVLYYMNGTYIHNTHLIRITTKNNDKLTKPLHITQHINRKHIDKVKRQKRQSRLVIH